MSETLGLFLGAGVCLAMSAFAYIIYQVGRMVRVSNDLDERYYVIEGAMLKKVAEGKGIDLEKELAVKQQFKSLFTQKSIRKALKEEVYNKLTAKKENNK